MMRRFKNDVYPLLKLAIPMSMTSLLGSAVFFFNTLFLAKLGPAILAAGALAGYLTCTMLVITYGILSSINVLVAHRHGANDNHGISLIVRDGICLALLLVVPTFLLFWNISPIFLLLGQDEAVVLLATAYLHAWASGILPQFIMAALIEVMMGLGRMRVILSVVALGTVLSIFFSFALIFGKFGLPILGIAGAGWGMSLTNWILAVGMILFLLVKKEYHCYFNHLTHFTKPSYIVELLQIGIPMGLMYCIEVGFFFALTLLMGTFGANILAANQIVMQYNAVLVSIIFSIAQAVTVRMGHLLGAGDVWAAKIAGYTGVTLSGLCMTIAAFFFWFCPSTLISIDFDINQPKNVEIVYVATRFLAVCAIFQIFEGCRITLFGALRAVKDTRFTLFISIISFWVISLPVGYFFVTHLKIGEVGLWWGMVLGVVFSVILLAWRLNSKLHDY
ncbi:MAG: MATE family efflux transporter [Gammaproteobacteria bacterium]|nr:MATE family efflux transporter [Gammaproteobacteria bacterium]